MRQIYKTFPGVQANQGVDLCLLPGEIHALLGENGAGKTTLMSILSGMYQQDSGEILLRGKPVSFTSPQDALAQGIGMIYQHLMLVHRLSVAENVVLGNRSLPFWINKSKLLGEVETMIREYGFNLDPEQKVGSLSLGEQQRVEILRALYRNNDILILDEPTSVLSPGEVRDLFAILRSMADAGRAVILITHKLNEVMAVADRVTILRRGQVEGSLPIAEADINGLTRMMIGREIPYTDSRPVNEPGPVVLAVKNLEVNGDRGERRVHGINLEVRQGEMLAIAGVAGNGQEELIQALGGLRPIALGQAFLQGIDVTRSSVRDLLQRGVRMIPEDRMHTGLVRNMGAADNLILRDYYQKEYGSGVLLNRQRIEQAGKKLIDSFAISVSDLGSPVRSLSGGNLQRIMLARELSAGPRLLLASYPSRGLDVGAAENVYNLLREARSGGTAILCIMEDLEEIMMVADRVAVMYNGRLSPVLPISEANLEQLGQWMAGYGL